MGCKDNQFSYFLRHSDQVYKFNLFHWYNTSGQTGVQKIKKNKINETAERCHRHDVVMRIILTYCQSAFETTPSTSPRASHIYIFLNLLIIHSSAYCTIFIMIIIFKYIRIVP